MVLRVLLACAVVAAAATAVASGARPAPRARLPDLARARLPDLARARPPPPSSWTLSAGTVKDCASGGAVRWSNFTMDPDPPARGENVTVVGTGFAARAVTGGGGNIAAKLNGLPIFEAPVATCGETDVELPGGAGTATFVALDCPTKPKGRVNATFAMGVPSTAPHGSYDVSGRRRRRRQAWQRGLLGLWTGAIIACCAPSAPSPLPAGAHRG